MSAPLDPAAQTARYRGLADVRYRLARAAELAAAGASFAHAARWWGVAAHDVALAVERRRRV